MTRTDCQNTVLDLLVFVFPRRQNKLSQLLQSFSVDAECDEMLFVLRFGDKLDLASQSR